MALTPIYAKERDDGRDGFIFGLGPADYDKVRQGYACGNCLEEFTAAGTPISLPECPVCREPTAIAGIDRVIEDTPREWTEYLAYRKRELDGPPRRA